MEPLFVAAVAAELGDLRGHALGVGALVAGVRLAGLLDQLCPSAVVLVGSAGAYAGGPPIGRAIAASQIGWGAAVADLDAGYVPLPQPPIDADPSLLEALRLPHARVLTTVAISTDPALVARRGADWQVEHLEAYGAALACAERGIPFVAVLGIANRVGPDAHAEWVAHRAEAEQAARTAARRLVG